MLAAHGYDDAIVSLNAAAARAQRSVGAFAATMAATYAEIDDEFRQHPDMQRVSDDLDRWYGAP